MVLALFLLFIISFFLALRSMKDFELPSEIKKFLLQKKIRGKIIFFKDKIVFYKNQSSSSS